MNEESPLTREEHHITSLNLTQGFRFDREGVTGEQGWQHAVTKCGKAQHSRASQNLDRKIMPGLFPGWMRLRHGLADLRTPSPGASAGLHGGGNLAARERHRLEYFFQPELRFSIRPLAWLLTLERALLFVSIGTVFIGHKNSTGLCSSSPEQATDTLGEKSVREVYNRLPNIC
jgi:hypothetical protein